MVLGAGVIGRTTDEMHLSQQRAKVVADYLIGQGLREVSIHSKGLGDRDTRLDQATSNNLKRRVEIYIRQGRAA